MVSHIDDAGFLRFVAVGGWDPVILVGQRVQLLTRDGPVIGVVGRKPIHVLEAEERKKAVELKGLHVDIGVADADEARSLVREGDPIVITGEPVELRGDRLISRALDIRLGVYVALEVARRVHEAGGKVAVHCALPEVIQAALDAGVDSLEHASFLQADQVPTLAAAGIAWVPTCSINSAVRQMLPPSTGALLDRQADVLCAAADAGVTVLAGTDAGLGPHGLVREEIRLLREAGLSSGTALGAGSWTARRWLGLPGLEPAAPADLVAYREDPRERPDILAQPAVVILHGVLARG
jgi:hypothetical protein